MQIVPVALQETYDLRRRVLRNHLEGAPAGAPTDELPGTLHLGASLDGRLVGVVTLFVEPAPGRGDVAAMRFRFMAVDPAFQGRGVGRALMAGVIGRARAAGARILWANGRDTALDFYRRLGFSVVGESFCDSTSGLPHHLVLLALT